MASSLCFCKPESSPEPAKVHCQLPGNIYSGSFNNTGLETEEPSERTSLLVSRLSGLFLDRRGEGGRGRKKKDKRSNHTSKAEVDYL